MALIMWIGMQRKAEAAASGGGKCTCNIVAVVRDATILSLHSIAGNIKNAHTDLCVYVWVYKRMNFSLFMHVCDSANTHFHFKIKFCFIFPVFSSDCWHKQIIASDTKATHRHMSAWHGMAAHEWQNAYACCQKCKTTRTHTHRRA